eukprot:scaffold8831_cov135-Isochrysis_galbana.AAC.7
MSRAGGATGTSRNRRWPPRSTASLMVSELNLRKHSQVTNIKTQTETFRVKRVEGGTAPGPHGAPVPRSRRSHRGRYRVPPAAPTRRHAAEVVQRAMWAQRPVIAHHPCWYPHPNRLAAARCPEPAGRHGGKPSIVSRARNCARRSGMGGSSHWPAS